MEANPDSLLEVAQGWERKRGATKENPVKSLQEKRRTHFTSERETRWMAQD